MGMRDGAFALTDPATFMDSVSNFFAELYYRSYLSVNPDYKLTWWEEEDRFFSFDLRDKYGIWNYPDGGYGSHLTLRRNRVPFGTYMPEEMWSASLPAAWEQTSFTEEEILQEELIPHPADTRYDGTSDTERILKLSLSPEWGAQRYRLVQKMRYCFIPLIIQGWGGEMINETWFNWAIRKKLTFRVPDYWRAEGTVHRIAVFMKNIYPDADYKTPADVCKWVTDGEFIIHERADGGYWEGASHVLIFGCVDLSTHPDFVKYFDAEKS